MASQSNGRMQAARGLTLNASREKRRFAAVVVAVVLASCRRFFKRNVVLSPTSTAVGVISRKTVDSLGQPVCLHSGFGGVAYIVTKVTTILLDFIAREGYM
jgi:hypothetical protein